MLSVAENPPKGDHLNFEIPFHDVSVGPDTSKQLVLPDPFARSFGEGEKDIEGATSEANGFACLQQKTPARQDLEPLEREGGFDRGRTRLCHSSPEQCVTKAAQYIATGSQRKRAFLVLADGFSPQGHVPPGLLYRN